MCMRFMCLHVWEIECKCIDCGSLLFVGLKVKEGGDQLFGEAKKKLFLNLRI